MLDLTIALKDNQLMLAFDMQKQPPKLFCI